MRLTKKIDAIAYKNGTHIKKYEEIVSDETTSLIIDNTAPRNFSTIPDSLEDFAIGYLIGEGLIKDINEIDEINIDKNSVNIKTFEKKDRKDKKNKKNKKDKKDKKDKEKNTNKSKNKNIMKDVDENKELVLCSDSSGGWRSRIKEINEVKSDLKVKKDELIENIERLRKNASIWQNTGGTHVAAFVNSDMNEFIVREDVSRHVAVDKAIGAAARKKLDFSKSYVIYSGRMPADMVIKVARAGIPILASNAAPSFSGYTTAEKGNITLVGFIRGDRFNVYTHTDRIIF